MQLGYTMFATPPRIVSCPLAVLTSCLWDELLELCSFGGWEDDKRSPVDHMEYVDHIFMMMEDLGLK